MATSQPIALPASTSAAPDVLMASGSFLGANTFNPASYTRHFLGSPLSWRAGSSFGGRFFPGCSPMGPIETNDFRVDRVSSSVESDRGSIRNALQAMEYADEHCRNYTCCGLSLTDLHALVDHFEECHVVVLDPWAQVAGSAQYAGPGMPAKTAGAGAFPPAYHPGAFDPDDMELDQDSAPSSGAPSPPETPISTPVSAWPSPVSGASMPVSAFETTTLLRHKGTPAFTAGFPPPRRPDTFGAYQTYADYAPPQPTPLHIQTDGQSSQGSSAPASPFQSVPPALLFSPSATPAGSRDGSPAPPFYASGGRVSPTAVGAPGPSSGAHGGHSSGSTARASTTLSRPASSLLLSKPFKCPKANCNKSYKQANGLKYHITHGSCNFAPPKEVEEVNAVLARRHGGDGGMMTPNDTTAALENLSESELREVEREAEKRLKPFACGIGECQRRYKNMNGLRYHYQHSGDHGAIGLALLASGQHECLRNGHGKSHSRHTTPSVASMPAAPSTPTTPVPPTHAGVSPYTPAMAQQAYAYLTQQSHFAASPFAGHPGSGLGLGAPYLSAAMGPGNGSSMGQQRS